MELLLAIFVLSFLILIHEFGHFVTAKKAGLLVEEFGFGLPPRLWGTKIGETIYSINWLPFGGFVKIYGENAPPSPEASEDKPVMQDGGDLPSVALREGRAFFTQPASRRLLILLAGVAMNFLFGILILWILLSSGVPAAVTEKNKSRMQDLHVEIMSVAEDSPAKRAGLRPGDTIKVVMGMGGEVKIEDAASLRQAILQQAGEELSLEVERQGGLFEVTAVPRVSPPSGQGALGVILTDVGIIRYPWWRAFPEAIRTAFEIAGMTFASLYEILKELFKTGKVVEGLAGPIGIVSIAKESLRLGIMRFLNLTALITINLAVLNVLPIPALDGGRILFLAIEKIRGRRVSPKYENLSHAVGMAVLLVLVLLISIHDIRRLL